MQHSFDTCATCEVNKYFLNSGAFYISMLLMRVGTVETKDFTMMNAIA